LQVFERRDSGPGARANFLPGQARKEARVPSTAEQNARIETLTGHTYDSPGDALAAVTETAAIINAEIDAERQRVALVEGFAGFGEGDFGERIRKWLNKLEEMLKKIAEQFEALSYTITVSWPMGVSISVTWSPSSSG
jgi:hypothetical protein